MTCLYVLMVVINFRNFRVKWMIILKLCSEGTMLFIFVYMFYIYQYHLKGAIEDPLTIS